MMKEISIEQFLSLDLPVIDVRSPGEYSHGRLPGAFNIPLFSDDQRAHVGTVYTKNSQQKAIELAFSYVNPKLGYFIEEAERMAPAGKVRVHCWRGGMRSQMFARHLSDNGVKEVNVLAGGYKAYRTHILSYFDQPFCLNIIGGYTGSGKSDIIQYMKKSGHQVIDLEELANHKGSAFGHIGLNGQPTTEQFENNLYEAFRYLDTKKPIWLEDESRNIGGVNIPYSLFNQMKSARLFFLDIPKDIRADFLVKEYAEAPAEELKESVRKISKRIGGLNTGLALRYIDEQKFKDVALLTLNYYDKAYLKSVGTRPPGMVNRIMTAQIDPVVNSQKILMEWMG